MRTTCRCGAEWTGMRIEHCPSCHETFTGSGSGDKHRTGDHAVSVGPTRRRCLTADEMRDKGMERNGRGQWTLGGGFWGDGAAQDGPAGTPEGDGREAEVSGAQNGAERTTGA